MNCIVYEPIQYKDKNLKHINTKILPKPPIRGIIVGSSGSGKSNFIKNIVFNWYKKYYDEIYIFIGSKDDAIEYRRLSKKNRMTDKVNVISRFNLEEIEELYTDIENDNIHNDEKTNTLFVFDDRVLNLANKYKTNIIDELFIKGRHARISTIISTQRYRLLNPNLRACNANLIVVYPSNRKELQAIAEEHSGLQEPKQFLIELQAQLKQRFKFIVLDLTKEPSQRFRNNKFLPIE